MRPDRLAKQHEELMEIGGVIRELMAAGDIVENARDIREALSNLFVKLTVHLASEDRIVYPLMLASDDEDTRETAKRFVDEMGGLGADVRVFRERWITHRLIMEDPETFRTQTIELMKKLTERIRREEESLYPLMSKTAYIHKQNG